MLQPKLIPTYTGGNKRIDFILPSQNLLPHISKTGYLPFYEANDSNHRGLFIDLAESLIDNKVELTRPPKRNIGSKCKKQTIYNYKQTIHKQCEHHRIYERAEEIGIKSAFSPLTDELHRKLITLDEKMITNPNYASCGQLLQKVSETE
jgi:hypothetical protein